MTPYFISLSKLFLIGQWGGRTRVSLLVTFGNDIQFESFKISYSPCSNHLHFFILQTTWLWLANGCKKIFEFEIFSLTKIFLCIRTASNFSLMPVLTVTLVCAPTAGPRRAGSDDHMSKSKIAAAGFKLGQQSRAHPTQCPTSTILTGRYFYFIDVTFHLILRLSQFNLHT